jgi:hypothetical protein
LGKIQGAFPFRGVILLVQRWVIAALAAGILVLGWYGWSGASRVAHLQAQLEKAAWS